MLQQNCCMQNADSGREMLPQIVATKLLHAKCGFGTQNVAKNCYKEKGAASGRCILQN